MNLLGASKFVALPLAFDIFIIKHEYEILNARINCISLSIFVYYNFILVHINSTFTMNSSDEIM